MQKEMPIFVRTFDFIHWLLPMTNHFPKAQKGRIQQLGEAVKLAKFIV